METREDIILYQLGLRPMQPPDRSEIVAFRQLSQEEIRELAGLALGVHTDENGVVRVVAENPLDSSAVIVHIVGRVSTADTAVKQNTGHATVNLVIAA